MGQLTLAVTQVELDHYFSGHQSEAQIIPQR
jgi:hypothetical protein